MNARLEGFADQFATQLIELALVFVAAAVVATIFGRRRPHLAYLVWMIVLVKALTPPVWQSPTSIFGWTTASTPAAVSGVPVASRESSLEDEPIPSIATGPKRVQQASSGAATVRREIIWSEAAIIVWLAGTLFCVSGMVWRYRRVRAQIEREGQVAEEGVQTLVTTLARQAGVRHAPEIRYAADWSAPALMGVWNPVIVLPGNDGAAPIDREPILAHELIHLRRRDSVASLIQVVAIGVWWWNPLVWIASRFATRHRERCCDYEVLGTFRYDAARYAQCLIDALRVQHRQPSWPIAFTIPAVPVHRRRLLDIMRPGQTFPARPPRRLWIVAAIVALLVLPSGRPTPLQAEPSLAGSAFVPTILTQSSNDSSNGQEDFAKPPELLYLTWQPSDERRVDKVWDRNGRVLTDAEAADVLTSVPEKSVRIHNRRPEDAALELPPLIVIYRGDSRIKTYPVFVTVITADEMSHKISTAINSLKDGIGISAAAPLVRSLPEWPERITLELRYPLEDPVLFRTVKEVPETPMQVAKGVTWYLDPLYAFERDPATGKTRPADGKIAGILEVENYEQYPKTNYWVDVYLRGEKNPIGEYAATPVYRGVNLNLIRYTGSFNSRDDIDRIEMFSRRFATIRIEDVVLRTEFLKDRE